MTEHKVHIDYEKMLYKRSTDMLKAHGILAIVFGALGVLTGLFITILMSIGLLADSSYSTYSYDSSIGLFLVNAIVFIFWTLPHIYLIIAGSYLVREPSPQLAKVLVITNLVVGVFWNLILVIFSIINLTQIADYKRFKK